MICNSSIPNMWNRGADLGPMIPDLNVMEWNFYFSNASQISICTVYDICVVVKRSSEKK